MNHRRIALLAASMAAAPLTAQTTPAPTAAAGGNILDKAINQPGTNWTFYGPNKAKAVKVDGIPGGEAVQVTIASKGANAYDVGGMSPIQKPIAAGDAILVAVYMRAPQLKSGETTPIPFVGATENDAPYASIAAASVDIGPEWKLYYAAGKAPKAFAPGKARGTVHLAAAKHVVELGPIFILDYGPNQDTAKLPHN